MTVTFFGHSYITAPIEERLYEVLENLIVNEGADLFYVGNHGDFDAVVLKTLTRLYEKHPHIKYYVVLAYIPKYKRAHIDYSKTIYPDGLENVPQRFTIDKRNRWMIKRSDTIVTYVTHTVGGASKYKTIAENSNKRIINLFS